MVIFLDLHLNYEASLKMVFSPVYYKSFNSPNLDSLSNIFPFEKKPK